MVTDNNGNFTPPEYGDPRDISMLKSGEPAGLTIMSLPPTRPDAYTTQVELSGDVTEAGKYVPLVTQQMMQMHQQNVNGLEVVNRPVDLGDGKRMDCSRNFTMDKARIHVPGKGGEMPPFSMNFDADTQKDFYNSFVDKVYGLGLEYDPTYGRILPNVISLNGKSGVGIETNYSSYDVDSHTDWANSYLIHSVDGGLGHAKGATLYVASRLKAVWGGPYANERVGGSIFYTGYGRGPLQLDCDTGLYSGFFDDALGSYAKRFNAVWTSDGYAVTEFQTSDIKEFVLCNKERVLSIGNNYDTGDGYGNRRDVECLNTSYYNGSIVNEYSETRTFYDNFSYGKSNIWSGQGSYGVGASVLYQQILDHKYHSEDQIKATTDKLAAKWGF